MQTFAEFELAAPILRSLEREGYTAPTPIQLAAIAPALEGRDLLACAQTGTGKTAAFLLPTIHRLLETPPAFAHRGVATPRALVLSPTRELASQIADSFGAYARFTQLRETTVVGGVSQRRQEVALARGCDLLVATPGRLQDLINQGIVDLGSVEVFVLDEADRMLDMGFIQPIQRIASDIPSRQTLMFSATMPAIADLATAASRPGRITIEKKPEIARSSSSACTTSTGRSRALLHHLPSSRASSARSCSLGQARRRAPSRTCRPPARVPRSTATRRSSGATARSTPSGTAIAGPRRDRRRRPRARRRRRDARLQLRPARRSRVVRAPIGRTGRARRRRDRHRVLRRRRAKLPARRGRDRRGFRGRTPPRRVPGSPRTPAHATAAGAPVAPAPQATGARSTRHPGVPIAPADPRESPAKADRLARPNRPAAPPGRPRLETSAGGVFIAPLASNAANPR